MIHMLTPTPPEGARFSEPESVPRALCTIEPGPHKYPRGRFTHEAHETTCRHCRRHPSFPKGPIVVRVACRGGCGKWTYFEKPHSKPGRRRTLWLCGSPECRSAYLRPMWARRRELDKTGRPTPCDGCGAVFPRAELERRTETIAGVRTVLRFCADCAKLEDVEGQS